MSFLQICNKSEKTTYFDIDLELLSAEDTFQSQFKTGDFKLVDIAILHHIVQKCDKILKIYTSAMDIN